MRKCYFLLLGLLSFIGVNTVSADTFLASNFYDNFETNVNIYLTYKENIDYLINYWEENYSVDYPYYAVVIANTINNSPLEDPSHFRISLYYGTSNSIILSSTGYLYFSSEKIQYPGHIAYSHIAYNKSTDNYEFFPAQDYSSDDFEFLTDPIIYTTDSINPGFKLLTSNFAVFSSNSYYDNLLFPSYNSTTLNISIPEFELSKGDVFPTISSLYDGSYISSQTDSYKQIDLNNYAYIALSLKDYEDIPSNNSSRYTNFYVKGQLCVTPVYNYGLTERKDVLTNSKMQGCSQYYDDFTLTRMYILKTDVENHAIYYFKAYDTSKDNILKVDTSIFNITYISEENKDNPEILINNKYYPTLSYDSLTDTATKSESEGYVSGTTCAVGDFNCYSENNSENLFDEIFSSPLDFLKSIWDSVTSIFSLIAEFISLLPVPMQSFLYLSFMIAIILGLLKILL